MTNREKAIADLTEWLESLDNERLAYVVASNTYTVTFICKHCVYYDDGDCKTSIDICQNVIKKCLEQE